jgi:hypothetical protein
VRYFGDLWHVLGEMKCVYFGHVKECEILVIEVPEKQRFM